MPVRTPERRGRRLLVRVGVAAALGVVLGRMVLPAPSWAAWLSGADGGGAVVSQSLPQGEAPVAVAAGRDVTVTWEESELSGGTSAAGYLLQRYPTSSGTPATMTTTCTGVIAVLSCIETWVPAGSWRYTVTPLHAGWTGGESSFGASVTVDPVALTTLEMFDANANGKIDRVVATFAVPLAAHSAGTAPWTVTGAPSGAVLASVSVAGSAATLTFTEGAGAASTAVGSFTIALAPDAAGIRDLSGNRAAFPAMAPADKAKPVLVSQPAFDANANGKFDRVDVTFSESLAAYSAGVTGWTMSSAPTGMTVVSVAVTGPTATLTLAEGTAQVTSIGSWRIALAANPAGIRDAAGNLSSYAVTAPSDAAAPVPKTITMRDLSGGNGIVDRVAIVFSETLSTYTAGLTPWTLASVPSGSSLSAVALSTATINLTLASPTGPADTTVGAFTVAMASDAAGVRDAAGNLGAFDPTTPIDGAGPAPIGLSSVSGTTVGRIAPGDSLSVALSEPLGPTVSLPASTTVTMTDPSTTASDNITVPGLFNGARSTGSNLYLSTDNTTAAFASSALTLSGDRRTITVTVGPACVGTGCATLGTATSAGNVSLLLDATLTDAAGVVPATAARNISARLF